MKNQEPTEYITKAKLQWKTNSFVSDITKVIIIGSLPCEDV